MFFSFVIIIVIFHYLGDWVYQTRYMADNKSKNWRALTAHISVYSLFLFYGAITWAALAELPVREYFWIIVLWVIVNSVLHGITDNITSRITSHFYQKQNFKRFFDTIGFDGMIHYLTLWISAKLILGL